MWCWSTHENPRVAEVLARPGVDNVWCDDLERAPQDALVGKLLCVAAAEGAARCFCEERGIAGEAMAALDLLRERIDDPSDARFARICSLLFDDAAPELDPHGVCWWALRTATSSLGNYEVGWALSGLCSCAVESGAVVGKLQASIQQAIYARSVKFLWA